ncbi:MAG: hypothetical protein AABW91_03120 [Nanoarchaeota archaeon]
MRKIPGYVLVVAGIVVLLAGVKPTNVYFQSFLPFLSEINQIDYILTGVGIAVLVIGVFLLRSSGGGGNRRINEVPIYHGKNIVGYRRV